MKSLRVWIALLLIPSVVLAVSIQQGGTGWTIDSGGNFVSIGQYKSSVNAAGTTAGFLVASNTPAYALYEAAGGADAKIWDWYADATHLYFRLINDAQSSTNNWLVITRSGYTVTDIAFGNATNTPTVHINGTAAVSCAAGSPSASFAVVAGIVTHC
jgi:hypothetical protein